MYYHFLLIKEIIVGEIYSDFKIKENFPGYSIRFLSAITKFSAIP